MPPREGRSLPAQRSPKYLLLAITARYCLVLLLLPPSPPLLLFVLPQAAPVPHPLLPSCSLCAHPGAESAEAACAPHREQGRGCPQHGDRDMGGHWSQCRVLGIFHGAALGAPAQAAGFCWCGRTAPWGSSVLAAPTGRMLGGGTRPHPQQQGAARAACSTRPRPPRRQMLGRAREEDGKYLKT